MSLDSMEAEIADLRAKAAELVDDYARTQHEISCDPSLTDSGKTDALTPLHDQMKAGVAALHQREKAVVASKREELERSLYGTTGYASDISSFREAQTIAARITDADEAHTMYTNALLSDDKMLARALFQRAGTQGWDRVTAEHLSRNPSVKATLADLEVIRRHEQSGGFGAAVNYMTPSLSTTPTGLPPFLETIPRHR